MTHPVRLMWNHHGNPSTGTQFVDIGTCIICTTEGPVIEVSKVVSGKFTDWDLYTGVSTPLWCEACVWAHSHHDLRTYAWRISPDECERLDSESGRLHAALSMPLDSDTAIIVPISRHKHLLPRARAGAITTDDTFLPWGQRQVEFLAVMARLRELGFGEQALTDPAPRWALITKMNAAEKVEVLQAWTTLAPWRNNPLVMAIAIRATRGLVVHV